MKQSFNKYSSLPRNLSRFDLSSSLVTKALKDSEIEGDGLLVVSGRARVFGTEVYLDDKAVVGSHVNNNNARFPLWRAPAGIHSSCIHRC